METLYNAMKTPQNLFCWFKVSDWCSTTPGFIQCLVELTLSTV